MGGIANNTLKEIKKSLDRIEAFARQEQATVTAAVHQAEQLEAKSKGNTNSHSNGDGKSSSSPSSIDTTAISRQLAHAMRYIDTMIQGWEKLGEYSKHILISYFWTVEAVAVALGLVIFHDNRVEYPRVFEEILGGRRALQDCNNRIHAVAKRYAEEMAASGD